MRVELFVVLAFVAVAAARTAFQGSNLDKSSFLQRLLERKVSQSTPQKKAEDAMLKIKARLQQIGDKKDVNNLRSILLKPTSRFSANKRTGGGGECPSPCDETSSDYWECAVGKAYEMEESFGTIYYESTDEELFTECMHETLWYFRMEDDILSLEELLGVEELYDHIAYSKFLAVWDDLDDDTQGEVLDLACSYEALRDQAYDVAESEKK